MRRTQLYLDEDLWRALHARARAERTTISELVRQAVRDRYVGKAVARKNAMQALVGLRSGHREFNDPEAYIRKLRRGARLDRQTQK
jgi:Ribbon-helix-helix protein, copG family